MVLPTFVPPPPTFFPTLGVRIWLLLNLVSYSGIHVQSNLFILEETSIYWLNVHSKSYSDSKNWFTFGKKFLARSIVAQKTKLNSWKFLLTKQSIMSLSGPDIKTLVSLIDLIQDLQ